MEKTLINNPLDLDETLNQSFTDDIEDIEGDKDAHLRYASRNDIDVRINKAPVKVWRPPVMCHTTDQCAVCLEGFQLHDRARFTCGHVYHHSCAYKLNKCPLCRAPGSPTTIRITVRPRSTFQIQYTCLPEDGYCAQRLLAAYLYQDRAALVDRKRMMKMDLLEEDFNAADTYAVFTRRAWDSYLHDSVPMREFLSVFHALPMTAEISQPGIYLALHTVGAHLVYHVYIAHYGDPLAVIVNARKRANLLFNKDFGIRATRLTDCLRAITTDDNATVGAGLPADGANAMPGDARRTQRYKRRIEARNFQIYSPPLEGSYCFQRSVLLLKARELGLTRLLAGAVNQLTTDADFSRFIAANQWRFAHLSQTCQRLFVRAQQFSYQELTKKNFYDFNITELERFSVHALKDGDHLVIQYDKEANHMHAYIVSIGTSTAIDTLDDYSVCTTAYARALLAKTGFAPYVSAPDVSAYLDEIRPTLPVYEELHGTFLSGSDALISIESLVYYDDIIDTLLLGDKPNYNLPARVIGALPKIASPTSSSKICRHFLNNTCQRGAACSFSHAQNAPPPPSVANVAISSEPLPLAATSKKALRYVLGSTAKSEVEHNPAFDGMSVKADRHHHHPGLRTICEVIGIHKGLEHFSTLKCTDFLDLGGKFKSAKLTALTQHVVRAPLNNYDSAYLQDHPRQHVDFSAIQYGVSSYTSGLVGANTKLNLPMPVLATDVAYYGGVLEFLADHMRTHNNPPCYLSFHVFSANATAQLYDDEGWFESSEREVYMVIKGNPHPYKHKRFPVSGKNMEGFEIIPGYYFHPQHFAPTSTSSGYVGGVMCPLVQPVEPMRDMPDLKLSEIKDCVDSYLATEQRLVKETLKDLRFSARTVDLVIAHVSIRVFNGTMPSKYIQYIRTILPEAAEANSMALEEVEDEVEVREVIRENFRDGYLQRPNFHYSRFVGWTTIMGVVLFCLTFLVDMYFEAELDIYLMLFGSFAYAFAQNWVLIRGIRVKLSDVAQLALTGLVHFLSSIFDADTAFTLHSIAGIAELALVGAIFARQVKQEHGNPYVFDRYVYDSAENRKHIMYKSLAAAYKKANCIVGGVTNAIRTMTDRTAAFVSEHYWNQMSGPNNNLHNARYYDIDGTPTTLEVVKANAVKLAEPVTSKYKRAGLPHEPVVMNTSLFNTIYGLIGRQFGTTLEPEPAMQRSLLDHITAWVSANAYRLRPQGIPVIQYIDRHVEGHKRPLYRRSLATWLTTGRATMNMTIMAKGDEIQVVKGVNEVKPRNLFCPHPSMLASGVVAYNLLTGLKKLPECSAGRTMTEICTNIEQMKRAVNNPRILCYDLTMYDAHQLAVYRLASDNALVERWFKEAFEQSRLPPSLFTDCHRLLTAIDMPFVVPYARKGPLRRRLAMRGICHGLTYSGHAIATTYGNTVRSIIYADFLRQQAGIPENAFKVTAAGDDTLIVFDGAYEPALRTALQSVFATKTSGTHGIGMCVKEYDITQSTFSFLSRYGWTNLDGSIGMCRIPRRVIYGNHYTNKLRSTFTAEDYRGAVNDELSSWVGVHPLLRRYLDLRTIMPRAGKAVLARSPYSPDDDYVIRERDMVTLLATQRYICDPDVFRACMNPIVDYISGCTKS